MPYDDLIVCVSVLEPPAKRKKLEQGKMFTINTLNVDTLLLHNEGNWKVINDMNNKIAHQRPDEQTYFIFLCLNPDSHQCWYLHVYSHMHKHDKGFIVQNWSQRLSYVWYIYILLLPSFEISDCVYSFVFIKRDILASDC